MAGLLTVNEAAEVLSVKPSTVWAWIHRGENLEVVKVGRAVRITSESLAIFVLANTRSPFSPEVAVGGRVERDRRVPITRREWGL
jgi:excisionase family DNA binding protein